MSDNVMLLPAASSRVVDVVSLRSALLEQLRSAQGDLAELQGYVLARMPLDADGRCNAYELRVRLEQRVQAVRWRLSSELLSLPAPPGQAALVAERVAACNDELSDECAQLESAAAKAWSHIRSVVQAVPLLVYPA